MRTGSTVLHVLCFYGVPDDPELNAKPWHSVLQCAARLGNAPLIVGGDLHFPPRELGAVPWVVLGHLLTQRLVDVDAAFAAGTRRSMQCSFHWQRVHPCTRMHGVLPNSRVAAMVTDVAALLATGIAGRLPVVFTMAMERATQCVVRAVRPQPCAVAEEGVGLVNGARGAIAAGLGPAAGIGGGGRVVVLHDMGSRGVSLGAVGARPAARGHQ